MAGPRDSSSLGSLGWLIGLLALMVFGVLAISMYVPPLMASHEVRDAIHDSFEKGAPTDVDEVQLARINGVLSNIKSTRYWVEEDGQHHDDNLQLAPTDITFTRDGNRQVSADVSYTQEMWMPIVKKTRVLTFAFHVDGPVR